MTRGDEVIEEFLKDGGLGKDRFDTLFPHDENGRSLGFDKIRLTMTAGYFKSVMDAEIAKAAEGERQRCLKIVIQCRNDAAAMERESGKSSHYYGMSSTCVEIRDAIEPDSTKWPTPSATKSEPSGAA
jgi:hypothetical protein